ncbi:MAG: type I-U CRISPR-associated protein Cas5/Cas6 [Zoogloeaceae bacterium]|nr:type I-U CRISPR-associated protein Cas5/Cas6 [Zoogloeaceae bacterium]
MFAIGIRYLMGWSMATSGENKNGAQWPPHPDRLFMALTAACFEAELGEAAERALRWLEALPAPALAHSTATFRREVTHYVPVNDIQVPRKVVAGSVTAAQLKAGLPLLPEYRSRQPRPFPVAIPANSDVYFIWSEAEVGEQHAALATLCANVTALGHSASLVQCWLEDAPPVANLAPTTLFPELSLRIPAPGRLDALVSAYNAEGRERWHELDQAMQTAKGKAKKVAKTTRDEAFPNGEPQAQRPSEARTENYRRVVDLSASEEVHPSLFDERLLILRRRSGTRLGLESTLLLTDVARRAILSRSPDARSEWLSGHRPDGSVSPNPHIALIPLPHVGKTKADGHLLGFAIVLPRALADADLQAHLGWLASHVAGEDETPWKVFNGHLFQWEVVLEQGDQIQQALKQETWTAPSRHWASVTPVVFDRHPKGAYRDEQAAALIAQACRRIGLPDPRSVQISEQSVFDGAPNSRDMPSLPRKRDGGRRYQRHVTLCFDEPIVGPVLLGAGRHRGYGLCRPIELGRDYS